MNTPSLQSALREWRHDIVQPASIAGILGAAAILALMGPFETDRVMRLVPRFAYWLVMVLLSFSAGHFCSSLADRVAGRRVRLITRIAIASVLTSVAVWAIVFLQNGLMLGYWPDAKDLLPLLMNVAAISTIVTAVFYIASTAQTDELTDIKSAPLLERLPINLRGPLVSLTVEDHYVRVRTTKGEHLMLMRLGDAIAETAPTSGFQCHRSHWIALGHVTAAHRKGDGAVLTLTHGPDIPVSRANMTKIKEAGLLP